MGVQVTTSANQIDKQRLGYCAISITNLTADTEPSIVAGSKIEIGGALYEFTGGEAGTGWAGIGASNFVYMLITPSGASCAWSYTTTAPTWDTAKQGYYTSGNRAFGFLWKDSGSLYRNKGLFTPWTQNGIATASNRLGKLWHLPLDNTTSRSIAITPAAASSWTAAITGAGVVGVPSTARGIRAKVQTIANSSAAGVVFMALGFSDNNSNVPSSITAHPETQVSAYGNAAAIAFSTRGEIDIPLNSSGQFYVYTEILTNCTAQCTLAAVGFYMGD